VPPELVPLPAAPLALADPELEPPAEARLAGCTHPVTMTVCDCAPVVPLVAVSLPWLVLEPLLP